MTTPTEPFDTLVTALKLEERPAQDGERMFWRAGPNGCAMHVRAYSAAHLARYGYAYTFRLDKADITTGDLPCADVAQLRAHAAMWVAGVWKEELAPPPEGVALWAPEQGSAGVSSGVPGRGALPERIEIHGTVKLTEPVVGLRGMGWSGDDDALESALAVADIEAGDAVSFGGAIALMKQGKKMRRRGWNGKGMYVVYQKSYPGGIPINANTAQAIGQPEGTVHCFQPYLMMRAADGSFVTGWLASQTDMLANDWEIARDNLAMWSVQISNRQVFIDGATRTGATVRVVVYRMMVPFDKGKEVWMREALALSYAFDFEQEGTEGRWSFEERYQGDEQGKVSLRESLWAKLETAKIPLRVTDRTGLLG